MRAFRNAKDSSELLLDGVTIEPVYHNGSLATITFTDAKGRSVKIDEKYGSLVAMVPAEPKTTDVHVLTGTVPVLGTPISETFESEYEACKRQTELERANVIENAEIKAGTVEIPF